MNALWALTYGDRHALLNDLRELRRRPGRAFMWALYLAAITAFTVLKTTPRSARAAAASATWSSVVNDLLVGGLAVGFGLVLASGPERWLGFFSSRAEALLLPRGTLPPVLVASYLQVRAIARTLVGGVLRLAYLFLLAIPAGTTVHALVLQLAFFGAAAAAITSVALPRALARGKARVAMVALGSAIALVAALPLVADALRWVEPAALPVALRGLPHPGAVLTALSTGDLRAIAVPLLVAALATVAFAFAARDAYPELYTISLANLDFRERMRTRRSRNTDTTRFSAREVAAIRSTRSSTLRGAAAFIWADALAFSRRVSPITTAVVAAITLVVGAGLALFSRRSPELFYGVAIGTLPGLCVAVTATIGIRLAPALRLPLFWLGDARLTARLAAWAFGGFWRDGALVVLAVAGFLAVSHHPLGPLLGLVAALGFLALTRSVGLAVFSLLPRAIDQRGPAVMLRTLLSFGLIAPPVIAGIVTAVFVSRQGPIAGTLVGTVIALAEAGALIAFAAWRLAGHVDRLGLA